MRRPTRTAIATIVAVALAAGCSRTPPGGEVGAGLATGGGAAGSSFDGGVALGGGTDASGAGGTVTSTGDSGVAAGGAAPDRGRAAAGPRGGTSAVVPRGSVTAPGPGVTGKTVKIVFTAKLENCSQSSDPMTGGAGTASEKGKRAMQEYVKYFNERVLGPYGWKLVYEVVDDGGPYCPEKARAAALRIAREIKPFAVLGDSGNLDQGPVVADVVTRAGIPHIGISWNTRSEIARRAPYAYPLFGMAEPNHDYLVGWIAKRVKGTRARAAGTGAESDRVWGVVAPDTAESRTLTALLRSKLRAVGVDVPHAYFVASDPGVAAQQATNTVVKMRNDGVNTLIFDMYGSAYISGMTFSSAMAQQNYLPELLIGNYGVAFFDRLHDPRVWERARGISTAGVVALRVALVPNERGQLVIDPRYDEIAENTSAYITAWRQLGYNDNPQEDSSPGAYSTWSYLSILVAGILGAGDTLNADTFAKGLHSTAMGQPRRCAFHRTMGRDWDFNPIVEFGRGEDDAGAEGFTSVYWVNKQTTMGTNGYYESMDNYRFFREPDAVPSQPIHDTGQDAGGPDIPRQPRIGIDPSKSCRQFGQLD